MGEGVQDHQAEFCLDDHFEALNVRPTQVVHRRLSNFDTPPEGFNIEEMSIHDRSVTPAQMLLRLAYARQIEVLGKIEY